MPVNNMTILNRVWLSASSDYQQRVSDVTKTGTARVFKDLFAPANAMLMNQFMDILVNRVAMTKMRSRLFENPLREFFGEELRYGSYIQEIALKWVKAHSYRDDVEDLLSVHRPDGAVAYYSIDRQDKYPISVNADELRRAAEADAAGNDYSLNELINAITQVPYNSANYDEYQIMKEQLRLYEERWGFFKEQISAVTNKATAEEMLVAARKYATLLKFPSSLYNGARIPDLPTFANQDELLLIIGADAMAHADVQALAAAYNMDKADVPYRIITLDYLPIDGAQALITTRDLFVAHDNMRTMTSFFNPSNLTTNYYYHVWQTIAVSPFAPAVLLTTDTATTVPTVTVTLSTLTATVEGIEAVTPDESIPENTYYPVEPGQDVQITVTPSGTVSPETDNVKVAPGTVSWTLAAQDTANNMPYDLDVLTFIDDNNVLHVSPNLPPNTLIVLTGVSTDPDFNSIAPDMLQFGYFVE